MKTSERPSLYDYRPGVSDMTEVFSLLDSLDQSPPAAWQGRLVGAAMVILLLLMLATMSLLLRPHARQQAMPVRGAAANRAPVLRKAALAGVAPASTTDVAAIVSERQVTPPDGDGLPVTPGVPGLALPEFGLADSPVPAAKAQSADSRMKRKPGGHVKQRSRGSEMDRHRSGVQHGKDDDVDLIAALLSRVARGEPGRDLHRQTRRAAMTAPASTVPKRVSHSLDVVVPQAGVPLAELVRRCRSLGLIEGELCRLRICSGKWGADPACPANSPPQ